MEEPLGQATHTPPGLSKTDLEAIATSVAEILRQEGTGTAGTPIPVGGNQNTEQGMCTEFSLFTLIMTAGN